MSLRLSSHDQKLFTAALRALVTLDIADPAGWEIGVLRALKPLVRAERGAFFYAEGGDLPEGMSEDYDADVLKSYWAYYAERDLGRRRLEQMEYPVFSRAMLFEGDLRPLLRSECYNEFLAPAQMADSAGMALPDEGSGSAGVLALHRSDAGSDEFAYTAPAVMRMLYPALISGWQARRRLSQQRDDLARMVDALPEPAAIYTVDRRLLHANQHLLELVSADGGGEELRAAMESVALARGHLLCDRAPGIAAPDLCTPSCGGFELRGMLLDSLLPAPVILITAEPADAGWPSTAELTQRFGLTPRQGEVALLLSRRLSNREIAKSLTISPHTALRHTEAVMAKLNVRDRRLVADRLRR